MAESGNKPQGIKDKFKEAMEDKSEQASSDDSGKDPEQGQDVGDAGDSAILEGDH